MEEKPLDDPAVKRPSTPEDRRRQALRARLEEFTGPCSRVMTVLKRVSAGVWYDGFIHAGNLAYLTLLALFPFFIAVTAIFAAFGEPAQRDASIDAFLTAVPPVVAKAVGPVAHDVAAARSGMLLWLGGLVGIWTASSLLETIRDILHRAYGTPQTKAFWQYRLVSTGVIFVSGILLLLSLFFQVAIVAAEEVIAAWFPALDNLFSDLLVSRLLTSVILYASIFLLFITLTPAAYHGRGNPKWPGALLVTVWWVVTTIMLPYVLRLFFTYDLTYGSLAGVMIALFFFWLIGLGIVVGAELNAALAMSPEERSMRERLGLGSRRNNGVEDE
ncbi:MAG: YihY/virulence factor BrkB family protein [Novosphingobium sp.]